jgi:hypothetical protein
MKKVIGTKDDEGQAEQACCYVWDVFHGYSLVCVG